MLENSCSDRNLPIGFCDSGVGGLSVFSKCRILMPSEDMVYYGDLKNVPYGSKTKEQLLEYLTGILDFFAEKRVKAVVLACNTTSAVVYDLVKDKYPFKIYPIIQSSAKILAESGVKSLGVFATKATINSGAYEREIKKYNSGMEVFSMACPGWVEIVENNTLDKPESVELVKKYLYEMLSNSPEKIVLGCTHYPFLKEIISKYVESAMLIDPAEEFSKFIKRDLELKNLNNLQKDMGKEEFFVSANPEQFKVSGSLFYSVKNVPVLL